MWWSRIGTSHAWLFTSGEVHIYSKTVKTVGVQDPQNQFLTAIAETTKIGRQNFF